MDSVQLERVGVAVAEEGSETFASWVAPHLSVLSAVAVREVGRAHAEDVVQDALLRAWRRRSTYRPERGSLRAWLVAIVLDQARRHRLRTLRRPPEWRGGAELGVQPDSASDDRIAVEHAVRELPRRQRQVVTLYYLADLPAAEIANLLGITASSVRVHLHAARTALQQTLGRT